MSSVVGPAAAVQGHCDARFSAVRDAFEENFLRRDEVGAAVCVWLDGRPVIDLWGGFADSARAHPWQRDTLVNVFSVGKGMVAIVLGLLLERGAIELDVPVARYWPEFAAQEKAGITVRMLAAHRAGLPGVREPLPDLAMYDWSLMTAALAREAPWWPPDTAHGYHVNTYGFLIGELVRRITGTRFGTFFRDQVARPLEAEFAFGIGPELDARIAESLMPAGPISFADEPPERREWLQRIYANPQGASGNGTVNTRAWRAAEIPSTNGHANARGIARIYAALLAPPSGALLSHEVLGHLTERASDGVDRVLERPSRFGLGFQLTAPDRPMGRHPHSFGHFGAGGLLGFADPDARLAFGYSMNRPGPRWQNPRTQALIEAVYASL